MKIAYVTYEHPVTTPGAGIATYIDQVAKLMTGNGHQVEVFTATDSGKEYSTFWFNDYRVHCVPSFSRKSFPEAVVPFFFRSHASETFHLIESAEYGADGLAIKKIDPTIPMVVKLHTPEFLVKKLNLVPPSLGSKMRFIIGGLLRGKIVKPYWKSFPGDDPERVIYNLADSISSPSLSLAEIVKTEWGEKKIEIIPNPFQPFEETGSFIDVTPDVARVLFIGRLERRKGIYEIIEAIPKILKVNKSVDFYFAGSDQPSLIKSLTVVEYMHKKLSSFIKHIHFLGVLSPRDLAAALSATDICLFPSIWENFPNVCLEAMFAGKAVIGSNNGGMAEIITHMEDGYLIVPNSSEAIKSAVLDLLDNETLRKKIGVAARKTILSRYAPSVVAGKTQDLYYRTIKAHS